jgi:xanthine dehydrogenase accessory factor
MHPWIETVHQLNRLGEAYVIVTVLDARGSTPRDSGTKMVVAREKNYGTIGGGHLEFQAIGFASHMLHEGGERQHVETFPLGPGLGQCCGGRVTLLFESFPGNDFNIMVFGAGHVGTALVDILKQLPCRLHWIDSRDNQHSASDTLPANVTAIVSEYPADEVVSMPPGAYYLILTYDHQMDFDILETVLKRRDALYVGLIGSRTKWKRFTSRLAHKGYDEKFFQQVHCPIGLDSVPGKHPIEVAVSVAAEVIGVRHSTDDERRSGGHVSWPGLRNAVNSTTSVQINSLDKSSHVSP